MHNRSKIILQRTETEKSRYNICKTVNGVTQGIMWSGKVENVAVTSVEYIKNQMKTYYIF